jgi:hypothetical protein
MLEVRLGFFQRREAIGQHRIAIPAILQPDKVKLSGRPALHCGSLLAHLRRHHLHNESEMGLPRLELCDLLSSFGGGGVAEGQGNTTPGIGVDFKESEKSLHSRGPW